MGGGEPLPTPTVMSQNNRKSSPNAPFWPVSFDPMTFNHGSPGNLTSATIDSSC